ncbi:glycosyltransferase [Pontibacter anaerobius]|uniref:Glycosyltransferase n=1 Tax=Pontibacter anaerobius TaxID=2993940 RepID=A0ABT3RI78_9BACT|nr:glycosyltransferase [Pontibacter anaerobius]MCX2741557.1 glycosyltransferase [Pontibacter anaerobius]
MNIFIVPSWYPSANSPIAGIFFKEQALSIAELNDNFNIGVSLWGQNNAGYAINKNPLSTSKALFNFWNNGNKTQATLLRQNLTELFTPTLTYEWPFNAFGDNMSGMISSNLANFEYFQAHYGQIDIIHAHVGYPAGYIAMVLAKRFGVPYVITEHMGPFPFKKFLLKEGAIHPKLSQPLENANKVIAVSPKLAQDISKFGFRKPTFIPNVINEDFFTQTDTPFSLPFKFFTLAMLSPEKGIDDLLQAIKVLTCFRKDFIFNIGGGGQLLDHYKSMTKAMKLEQHIVWHGEITRDEAKEQYKKCHAFVLPSHGETFGVVYAEAIASGKPVVATKCGGPECIINEGNGLLSEIRKPEDLAQNMLFLIENYSKYSSERIRAGFEAKFSKRAVVPQIIEVYKSLE